MNTSVETPVRVPMDPRIRQRRIDVQRAAGRRRRLRVLVAAVSVLAAGAAAYGLSRSPVLDVDAIRVRGLDRTSADDVLSTTGLAEGRQLADVDTNRAAARLESLPWVHTAEVRRDWPGSVEIEVVERDPFAVIVASTGQHFAFVDEDGRLLGHAPPPDGALPRIVGAGEVPAPGKPIDGARPALSVLAALGGRPPVSEVHVRGDAVDVVLTSGPVVQLGTRSELREKIVALRTLAARVDLSAVAVVDLRVPAAPALTPR